MSSHITNVGKGIDYLVLWLDCDREGENICFEILDLIGNFLPVNQELLFLFQKDRVQRVYRAKFSSIAEPDILAAYHSLVDPPNLNQSLSVDARQILDLKVSDFFTNIRLVFASQDTKLFLFKKHFQN